ncbi:glycosyltransferase [Halalkalibacter sp. APA_J-10(15)]|uniref:tetratricopeptide repeat-containing glycosyltransferase n=1 Tax=Halalkalibacter sp. APA_J-10(15) TaxID=2933805 RepID=UPI001FF6BBA3|nr:glycosyltransferase [Halalkalibacter sp. APA_J-10(15)]MCK0473047.1 glycosyltransferase [Halalkalibacter sp. APA_J-10(15)]
MSRISLCILVKNEGYLLEKCLKTIKGEVEEIIVVNNGSIDNTKQIAESYGSIVIDLPNSSLDNARQAYLEAATQPWILVLDADEMLYPKDIIEIKKILLDTRHNVMGYRLPRYEYIGKGKWASIDILRLTRNDPRIKYTSSKIHATLSTSINDIEGEMEKINSTPIHHFDILYKNKTSRKRDKYIQHLKEELIHNSRNNPHLISYLGVEYFALGNYEKAEALFLNAIKTDKLNLSKGRLYLAQLYFHLRKYIQAESQANLVLKEGSPFLQDRCYTLLADIYVAQKNFNKAIEHSESALNIDRFGAHNYINMASLLQNTAPKLSIQYSLKAIDLNPMLLNHTIYDMGEKPNIFEFQSSFISSSGSVFDILIKCFSKLNRQNDKEYWVEKKIAIERKIHSVI